MKVVSILLFSFLLSESIYAVNPRLPGENYEDTQRRIQSDKKQNESSPQQSSHSLNSSDMFGRDALTHLDIHGTNGLSAPNPDQKVPVGERSTAQQSVSIDPGYRPDVNDLVRRNHLDVHGENAEPARRGLQVEKSSPVDGKNSSVLTPPPILRSIHLNPASIQAHGLLDSISKYGISGAGSKGPSSPSSGAGSKGPSSSPSSGAGSKGPSSPSSSGGNSVNVSQPADSKPTGVGESTAPSSASSSGSSKKSAGVNLERSEMTYLDGHQWVSTGRKAWQQAAYEVQQQHILTGPDVAAARRKLATMHPDSPEYRSLSCRLSFWD